MSILSKDLIKSDQNGIESLNYTGIEKMNATKIKSDQNGIERPFYDPRWYFHVMIKSDQNGIES